VPFFNLWCITSLDSIRPLSGSGVGSGALEAGLAFFFLDLAFLDAGVDGAAGPASIFDFWADSEVSVRPEVPEVERAEACSIETLFSETLLVSTIHRKVWMRSVHRLISTSSKSTISDISQCLERSLDNGEGYVRKIVSATYQDNFPCCPPRHPR
jgi:hypothetical protein